MVSLDSPLFLEPSLISRVWGGDALGREFGRVLESSTIGESWEVHGDLQVRGQEATLDQLVVRYGSDLVGTRVDPAGGFPLLTKWLDCREWLSVQVHPDDALAQRHTGDPQARGKTEAWYVHKVGPNAELIHGLADGVKADQVGRAEDDDLVPLLRRFRPHEGQMLYTAAGVIHALGPDNLIYEVQQSCDITYRFYDWGRPREVHRELAQECLEQAEPTPGKVTDTEILCPYFHMRRLAGDRRVQISSESFAILAFTGRMQLAWPSGRVRVDPGQSVVLPANLGEVHLEEDGEAHPYLFIEVPQAS